MRSPFAAWDLAAPKGSSRGHRSTSGMNPVARDRTHPLPRIKVVNTVVSSQLTREINLERLGSAFIDSSYNPETFPGLIYRRLDPRATMIMFSTGKLVSTGASSVRKARRAITVTAAEIGKVEGTSIRANRVRVENLVVTGELGSPLDLARASVTLNQTSYEPEVFPGVMWKGPEHTVVLVFSSGKVVCTGARRLGEAARAVSEIARLLEHER